MKDYWRGVILTLLAAVCWGLISPTAKILSAAGINLLSVVVFRALFVAVFMGPWLLFTKGRGIFFPTKRLVCVYFISGLFSVVFAGGGFLMSLKYFSVPEALIIHYTFPLFTLLGSLCITHERPTKIEVFSGFLIIIGVYYGMAGGEKSLGSLSVPGLMWGGLAIIGISGQTLVTRRFSKGQNTDQLSLLFFAHLFGVIVLFSFKSYLSGWTDLLNFTPKLFSIMVFQAFSGSLLAYGFFYTALKYIPASTVSLLCTLEIVVAIGLTALMIGQIPSYYEVVGCAVIIFAIFCTALNEKKSN